MAMESDNIAQGHLATKTPGTNTVNFLYHNPIKIILADRKIKTDHIVVDYRPQKPNPNRVRITVGWGLIECPDETATQTVDLATTKILWNNVISTPSTKYICGNAKNFYLNTPMCTSNICNC